MKSRESSQLELAVAIYTDATARCAAVKPSLRDLMTIRSRVKYEGLSFLTIALPQFGKDFERSLAEGAIAPTAFRSFRKTGAIPAFLQGMLARIFDRITGRILDEATVDISCVDGIRQVAYSFKKLEIDCTEDRVQAAVDNFVKTERDLHEATLSDGDIADFCDVSTVLWDCLFDVNIEEVIPRHGPGATVEHVEGNTKYVWQYWHDRLEPYFPLLDYAYTVGAYGSEELENVTVVSTEQESPVRVTPVPKTQKGPRIIAIEPCCMQYAQQAIRSTLYRVIESSHLSQGHVNFTDQGINRALAMSSSIDGRLATIDLSDASDRVLSDLAFRMFDCNPVLREAIRACRSTRAELPDGSVIGPLAKFASMGSALCFPVESMYFYTICVGALLKRRNLPVTRTNIYKVSRDVYVYGDDILVPSDEAAFVVGHLQKYYCKVNMSKSYWTGKFRESCGMDAYAGVEVTPTYIKRVRPNSKRQAKEIISWIETGNRFLLRGYYLTGSYMLDACEQILGKLPEVRGESPMLGRTALRSCYDGLKTRWNKDIHAREVKAWTAEPVYRTDELVGYGALQKCLLHGLARKDMSAFKKGAYSIPAIDEKHLERSARHGVVALKRRWVIAA